MTIKERKELLACPCWDYKQVMAYTGYKKTKAIEIMNTCRKQLNGEVLFDKHKVKRNSVLAYMQTSLEVEVYSLNLLEQEESNST